MLRCLVLLMLALGIPTTLHAGALLARGDAFPAWTLSDQTGATVSSRDLAGKTYLLWFYPKAMTPGCTTEGDGLREQLRGVPGAAGRDIRRVVRPARAEQGLRRGRAFPVSPALGRQTLARGRRRGGRLVRTARRPSYLVSGRARRRGTRRLR